MLCREQVMALTMRISALEEVFRQSLLSREVSLVLLSDFIAYHHK